MAQAADTATSRYGAGRRRCSRCSSTTRAARISARWTVRTPVRMRLSPPPMCIRQELSPALHSSARVDSTLRILSASMAVETSGFFTREGAAEPAARLRLWQLYQVDPAHLAEQAQRPVADPQQPQGVAGRVVGHPVREVDADVGDPEHVDQELRQFVGARRQVGGGGRQALVAGLLGDPACWWRTDPAQEPLGTTTAS
jgi:hypothetical protein